MSGIKVCLEPPADLVTSYYPHLGPISVTIHVKNTTTHISSLLTSLHELYMSTPGMSTTVDVHLVIDSFDRQFNTWRNIARLFARTDYVMMLDVDFAICTDFRTAMRSSKPLMDKLREGKAAFVIPAFEYVKHSDGTNQSTFPKDKEVRPVQIDLAPFLTCLSGESLYKPSSKPTVLECFIHLGLQAITAQTIDAIPLPMLVLCTKLPHINRHTNHMWSSRNHLRHGKFLRTHIHTSVDDYRNHIQVR